MFIHHLLEILNYLKADVVLLVAKIHKRTGVCSVFGYNDLACTGLFGSGTFMTCA